MTLPGLPGAANSPSVTPRKPLRIRRATTKLAVALLFGSVLIQAGCGDDVNVIGPGNQLEATNATDQFQFQLTALEQVSDSRTYDWQHTGTTATVDVSAAITNGSAVVTIRDTNGDVVYQEDMADGRDGFTSAGNPGTWQIEVVLAGTTGTFNFRVQKSTCPQPRTLPTRRHGAGRTREKAGLLPTGHAEVELGGFG